MQWDPTHTFRRLLISQIALTLVYPLVGEAWHINFLLGIFFIVALYGGVSVTVSRPHKLWISAVLGVCFVSLYWIDAVLHIRALKILAGLFGAAFFWFIAFVIMKYVFFFRSKVNVDLIYGSISAYLLIGNGFGELYVALAIAIPDSFEGLDLIRDLDYVTRSLTYYSFVTLTTLGYGDITPATHYTRVLAYTEAILGQLYLTILVARLVGTYIAQTKHD